MAQDLIRRTELRGYMLDQIETRIAGWEERLPGGPHPSEGGAQYWEGKRDQVIALGQAFGLFEPGEFDALHARCDAIKDAAGKG